jgi:hypothetical protein
MELSSRTLPYVIVPVLLVGGLIGCKSSPTNPPVASDPVTQPPGQPTGPPPSPCLTGKFHAHCFTIPADTPVVVFGGSIDIDAKAPFQGSSTKFTATGNNIGSLSFDGFDQFPASQQFSGWVLRISNKSKNSVEKPEAIKICSNKQCDGLSLDPNNTIYIKVRSGAWLAMPASTQLVFHDSECDGSSSNANPGENRQCDFFMKLRVKSHDLAQDLVAKCSSGGTDGLCAIGIGKN